MAYPCWKMVYQTGTSSLLIEIPGVSCCTIAVSHHDILLPGKNTPFEDPQADPVMGIRVRAACHYSVSLFLFTTLNDSHDHRLTGQNVSGIKRYEAIIVNDGTRDRSIIVESRRPLAFMLR
jgi:hypothetical protein